MRLPRLDIGSGYEPVKWLEKVKRDLSLAGFNVTVKWNDRKTVNTAWIRIDARTWKEQVRARLNASGELDLAKDAAAFLERREDAALLT